MERRRSGQMNGGGVERLVLRQWVRASSSAAAAAASSLLTSAGTETGSGPAEV